MKLHERGNKRHGTRIQTMQRHEKCNLLAACYVRHRANLISLGSSLVAPLSLQLYSRCGFVKMEGEEISNMGTKLAGKISEDGVSKLAAFLSSRQEKDGGGAGNVWMKLRLRNRCVESKRKVPISDSGKGSNTNLCNLFLILLFFLFVKFLPPHSQSSLFQIHLHLRPLNSSGIESF